MVVARASRKENVLEKEKTHISLVLSFLSSSPRRGIDPLDTPISSLYRQLDIQFDLKADVDDT